MPKVSVIIPVYNVEPYLRECLSSAVNQTLKDIEIICVDDASSDKSREIIEEFSKKDSRFQVYGFVTSRSALVARKQGVMMATGEYILFLDSDDYLEPYACEELYEKITQEKVEILHFNSVIENCANIPKERIEMNKRLLRPYNGYLNGIDIFEKCFQEEKYGFTLWNKLFSADLCKRVFFYIEDIYLPKAQDMYTYFVIAYFAESYLGWSNQVYHHYCFGRGVTGSEILSLSTFKKYCLQSKVADALERFVITQQMDVDKTNIVSKYRERWLNECIDLWFYKINSHESDIAAEYLFQFWNKKEVVFLLAQKHWYHRDVIAQKIGKIENLPLEKKTVKTIGIYYYHFTIGGVQRVISLLIPLFVNMGYRVVFITDKEVSEKDIVSSIDIERVTIFDYQKTDRNNYNVRLEQWEKIIHQYNIDILFYHAWTSPLLLWDMLFMKLNNVSVVIHTHSVFSYSLISMSKDFSVLPRVFSLSDGIVVLSRTDKAFWDNFNDNVHYIPNPIDKELLNAKETDGESDNIVWVGRFSNEKQPWEALDIMEKVVVKYPQAKLQIIGDSSDPTLMKKYKKMVERKNLVKNVDFLGYQDNVNQFFSKASVYLITSLYEGYSMTLLEAQAHGVPTVMYEMGYLELAKDGKCVVSVEPNDREQAAIEIIQLLTKRKLWKSRSDLVKKKFFECSQYDYKASWQFIISGGKQIPTEDNRIMMETLLKHYKIGWEKNHKAITKLNKNTNETRLLWLIRKLYGGILCYQEHGLSYTLNRIREKFLNLLK